MIKSLLIQLFGTYEPVTDTSGVIANGFAGVDWPFVFSCLIFCIVLFCVLRMIGGILAYVTR